MNTKCCRAHLCDSRTPCLYRILKTAEHEPSVQAASSSCQSVSASSAPFPEKHDVLGAACVRSASLSIDELGHRRVLIEKDIMRPRLLRAGQLSVDPGAHPFEG